MRLLTTTLTLALVCASAVAQEPARPTTQDTAAAAKKTPSECHSDNPGKDSACEVSKQDQKAAWREYSRGLKLREKGSLREAYEHFRLASGLHPTNVLYADAREIARQQLVHDSLYRGNAYLNDNRRVEAMAEFRTAMALDGTNEFTRQRIRDVLGDVSLPKVQLIPEPPGAAPVRVEPNAGLRDFHFRGNSRDLLEQISRAYGLTAIFDESVLSRAVRFDVTQVDFVHAIAAASQLTKTFFVPLTPRQIMFVTDSQQNRQSFERMVTRTFYVPEATSPQELNDIVNTLRIMFEIRFIVQQPANGTITMRAPVAAADAATRFLQSLSEGRPEVMFSVQAFEVSRTFARQVGVDLPLELQVFNVPTEAQKLLGNRSIQDVINQLIASGLINQGNTTAIAALVAQFLGQNSSPLVGNTLFLFGGGTTQEAIPIPPGTFHFSANDSSVRSLENLTLRASHGTPAVLKIGSRVPIINATFAPIFNSPQLSQVLQNQTFKAPIPSFQYEDVGVDVKATPLVREDSVSVNLEMQIRAIGPVSLNGVPVFSNREYKGTMTVKNGERIVVAGMLSNSERRSMRGLPVVSYAPVIGRAVSSESIDNQESEILIVLTPHIIRARMPNGPVEQPLPASLTR